MSDPIGNIPVENSAIHSQPENVSVLSTKVSETALPILIQNNRTLFLLTLQG